LKLFETKQKEVISQKSCSNEKLGYCRTRIDNVAEQKTHKKRHSTLAMTKDIFH
jgi:hypothetical protein